MRFFGGTPEPNVLLGLGEHVIDLIVNDGMEDSEPNSCVVTVVEAMQAEARILPRFLNRTRHGRYVIGWLMLPEGVGVDDVNHDEPLLLLVGDTEIEAQRQFVLPGRRRHGGRASIFAFFDAEALLEAVGENGNIEMMLATRLMSGQAVYGTDQVRIFAPPRRPH